MLYWMRKLGWLFIGCLSLSGCIGLSAQAEVEIPTARVDQVEDRPTQTVMIEESVQINATPTASPTLRPSSTLFPIATPIPSFTTVPSPTPIPDSFYISGVQSFRQSYPLSCESRTAVDWAAFFDVFIYESDFQFDLPRSDNPDKGFVGEVHDPWGQIPPYSYGVHAQPVAALLKEDYGLPSRAMKNMNLDDLKKEIASGQPLIAWVIGNMVGGIADDFIDQEGNKVLVAPYEHTVIVTGYSKDHIRYLNNSRFYQVPVEVFLNSWGVLGNMAIYYQDPGEHY